MSLGTKEVNKFTSIAYVYNNVDLLSLTFTAGLKVLVNSIKEMLRKYKSVNEVLLYE